MNQNEALGILTQACSTDPRSSVVGIRQGASFAFDPVVFAWFESIESLGVYLGDGMKAIHGSGLDFEEESFVTQQTICEMLADRNKWTDVLESINEIYWQRVQTQWIGTFEELSSDQSSALGSSLRAAFRNGAEQSSHGSHASDSQPINNEEVGDFIEFLAQAGT